MKKFIFVIAFIVSSMVYAQDEASNLNWLLDYNEAIEISKNEQKPVLVYFTGSDWCAPCKMLKKDFFNTSEFANRAKDMVLLMVDIPRRVDIITKEQKEKNLKLVRKYNKSGGYPNLVALNSKGEVIGELGGYTFLRETDRHFAFVDSVIENYN
jgi:thioredoxin-related protein